MSLVVVGLNHKTAPVDLLERLSISEEDLPKALHQLTNYEHVVEGMVLSTCNRTEVYATVSKFHGGALDIRNFLAEFCHIAPEDFVDTLYTYHDEGAVRHLFRVGAGVDSMIVGESEILGQVRRAFQIATSEGAAQGRLSYALRKALRVGKRARTETAIGRNPVSISSAAVELARRAFPSHSLGGKRVLVVGAGKMGRLAMQALRNAGASAVTVINRGEERARVAAEDYGVPTRRFEDLPAAIADADIVITSTTAPDTVIDVGAVELASKKVRPDPLLIVDIAVPRDVDSDVARLPNVVVRDIDDLKEVVERSIGNRLSEVSKVESIIAEELSQYEAWERAAEIEPAIASLVSQADAIRESELSKLKTRLKDLTPEERQAVDQMTRRIVSKLLHSPLDRAKELASSPHGPVYLAALRELFELDDDTAE